MWVTVSKPSAELEAEGEESEGTQLGTRVQIFRTRFGVRFARVVEPSGFILWLQEVPDRAA